MRFISAGLPWSTFAHAQRLISLHEPHRADKFRAANEPEPRGGIHQLVVREINDEE